MEKLLRFKSKLLWFLAAGILILCGGFLIVGCGNGPQGKVMNATAGQWGVDFSLTTEKDVNGAPSAAGFLLSQRLPNLGGKEFTIEAWVKRKTETLQGGVFSRFDSSGTILFVKENEPQFGLISRTMTTVNGVTSTTFITDTADSNFAFEPDTWYHVAGVLVNEDHSAVHAKCRTIAEVTNITPADLGQHASIALDSSRKIHISYYDATSGDLRYATNASGAWVTEAIDTTGDVGQYTDIAIRSDKVFISYYDDTNDNLKYATNASGAWVISTIDGDGTNGGVNRDVGQYTSIAVDSTNLAHISYYDLTNAALRYAKVSSTVTVSDAVDDTANDVGKYSSIALDAGDDLHISYYDATNGNLKYAECFADCNLTASWTTANADTAGNDVGQYSSIAIDTSGAPKIHVSYYDATGQDLKYASRTVAPGAWTVTGVDTGGNIGQYSAISTIFTDAVTKVFISYYDATNGNLKIARNGTGAWVASTVDDSADDVGRFTSISTDATSTSHISHYDVTNGALRYAQASSTISLEEVEDDFSETVEEEVETDANAETPHLDIYVNGEFKNCASTDSQFLPDFAVTEAQTAYNTLVFGNLSASDNSGGEADGVMGGINGIFDEIRFWTVARTQEQLQECMGQELALSGVGNCVVDTSIMGGYLRFNEGTGSITNDWSGYGDAGIESPSGIEWSGAWSDGFTSR